MAKSFKEELQDLQDWIEILRERLKEKMSEDMSNLKLLALLITLFFVVLLGGVVIGSSESLYGPIISTLSPTVTLTPMPTILPATATPNVSPTLKPVPLSTPVPGTTNISANTTLPSGTPTPYPKFGWDYGGGDSGQKSVPVASFICPSSVTAGDSVSFTDTSTGSIDSRAWDFNNDGSTDSTQANPTYTYVAAGTYTIKLTVTNSAGSNSQTAQIVVDSPVASISAQGGAVSGQEVSFMGSSTGSPVSWSWSFGDGSISSDQNPKHTYTHTGEGVLHLVVQLIVTYTGGISSTATHNIDITNGAG